jgi:hypothetical protein
MKVSTDTKELIQSYAVSILEAYKVLMACLLSIFVPQYCPETNQTCTLKENFSNLSMYNEFVIAFNFITLGLFLYLYTIQNRRETYLITHLDADKKHSITSFIDNCKDYPKIVSRVVEYNKKLQLFTKIVSFFFYLNAIFSGILVGYFYYDGFRTATTLIANVLLVSSKLFSMWSVMTDCNNDPQLALSTYQVMPVGYNVIDNDYITESVNRHSVTTKSNIEFTTVIKE